jgi:hypothetical protein
MEEVASAGAVYPRERLNLARLAVPAADPPRDQQLTFWLANVPVPADLDDADAVSFRASVTCDLQRLTWWADGAPGLFIPAMADYLEAVGAPEQEMERLKSAGLRLQPDRLGTWIVVAEDLFDAGWYMPGEIPLSTAFDFSTASEEASILKTWATEHSLATCASLGRSIGEGDPFTALEIPLAAGSAEEQVSAALGLFDTLGVPAPPDMALGAILSLDGAALGVSAWLLDHGLAKLGLLAARPPIRTMLDICETRPGFRHADNLAAFSGVLGQERPESVECEYTDQGFEVVLHYKIASGGT